MKPRVCMLVPSLGQLEGQGGVDRALLEQLLKNKQSVTVFSGGGVEGIEKLDVDLRRIPRLPAWQLGNLLVSLLTTTPRVRKRRYRIIHADPGVALRRAHVMVCHTVSAVWRELPDEVWREPGLRGRHNDAATRFKAWLEIRQLRKAKVVLVASRRTQLDLEARGVVSDRISLIPFAVDSEHFRPPTRAEKEAAREVLGINAKAFVVAIIGPHGPRKGLPVAISAVAQGPGDETLLAPGDRRGDSWVAEAEAQGVRFVAPGKMSEVRHAYWAADVLVHPSRYDAFGMSVLEAMSCGLPVIVSREAGVHEIVRDAGFVLTEHSAEALRAAIDALRRSPERRAAMGRRGREIALVRTWDEAGEILLQAYATAAENR
jgi:glycosyltransferase involved in cell wall biosynthesis